MVSTHYSRLPRNQATRRSCVFCVRTSPILSRLLRLALSPTWRWQPQKTQRLSFGPKRSLSWVEMCSCQGM